MLFNRYNAVFGAWRDVWMRGGWRVQVHGVTGRARALDGEGHCVAAGSEQDCIAAAAVLAPRCGRARAAVLLHGLWNGPDIMAGIEERLAKDGWAVANAGYPSRRLKVAAHGAAASQVAAALTADGAREVALVGHSLGGLVAREAAARAAVDGWNPGALVLIGSPARGSDIARRFQNVPGFDAVVGACGEAVTPAGAQSIPMPACRDVLVIAGGTGGGGYNPLIVGDDDGLIAVAETRLPGYETSFVRVRALHKDLPRRPEVIEACAAFLNRA